MELDVIRFSSGEESTLGMLFVDKKFACYTLEDEARTVKVFGETCIPAGRYKIALKTIGEHHSKYKTRFRRIHKGMLEILDVPNFTDILIHVGNTDDDTAGCLLLGDQANNNTIANGKISQSANAYKRVYPPVAEAVESGEDVWINYSDKIFTEQAEPDADAPKIGSVNTNKLNLRLEPGLSSMKAGILRRGTPVSIVKKVGGWYRVRTEGWLLGEFVDSEES